MGSRSGTAVKLFQMWGVGKKTATTGCCFVVDGDRRVRVEVGYGLEGALPDGKVGAILDRVIRASKRISSARVLDGVGALIAWQGTNR